MRPIPPAPATYRPATRRHLVVRRQTASKCRGDVGLLEISALEEKCLARCLGERIGETVAEVKPGFMATLTEVGIRLSGYVRLLFGHGLNDDPSAPKESIELTAAGRFCLRLDNDRHFNKVGSRDPARVSVSDSPCIAFCIVFVEQDREDS